MKEINYFGPATIAEATSFLQINPDTTIFAGGTDLLVKMEYKTMNLKNNILDLKGIGELEYIKVEDDELRIGAMTTITDILENDIIDEGYKSLSDAAHKLASWQVRNTATIGGNICNAAPSAEMVPPLIVLGSKVIIAGPDGEREMPLSEFMVGPGETALKEKEILKEIKVPQPPKNSIAVYECRKWKRTTDVAIVNLAVLLVFDEKTIKEARICLGAVAPTAFRSLKTENMLINKTLNEDLIEEVAVAAVADCKPISDVRASADYRREMVKVCLRRALLSIQEKEA